jgi:hypothetical protein
MDKIKRNFFKGLSRVFLFMVMAGNILTSEGHGMNQSLTDEDLTAGYGSHVKKPLSFLKRTQLHSFSPQVNSQIQSGKIRVSTGEAADSFFTPQTLEVGDYILLNPQEAFLLEILQEDEDTSLQVASGEFIPAICLSQKDGEKTFGLIPSSALESLEKEGNHSKASLSHILNHPALGMTVVYALCPPHRKSLCSVIIKQDGKWVTDDQGKPLIFRGIAQSRRHDKGLPTGIRLQPNSDTPQGIYWMLSTMLCNHPGFGGEARIDLDGTGKDLPLLPLNGHPYDFYKPMIDALVPPAAQKDYWINEWPLAYALGRHAIRIHTNGLNQPTHTYEGGVALTQTAGCLNLGKDMEPFLTTLETIGVLDKNYEKRLLEGTDRKISWNVGEKWMGRAFMILLDGEIPLDFTF